MAATRAVFADVMIDGTGRDPVRDPAVLLEGDRVIAAGSRRSVRVPRDAERIDAGGMTLLPGLIDTHVHLIAPGRGLDAGEVLATEPSLVILRTVAAMRATLDAGFTTVRDAGGLPAGVRRAVAEGVVPGPRMQLALSVLSPTGGHTDRHMACGLDLRIPLPGVPASVVDGPEAVRGRVREVLRAGADWVKVCASGGILSAADQAEDLGFAADEMRTAVEEAAGRGGRRVMAHALSSEAVGNALSAGVASIEHGLHLTGDNVEMLLESGAFLVPTLVAPLWVARQAAEGRMPEWVEAKVKQACAQHRNSVAQAVDAGVRVAFGTDTGVGPHGSNGGEFLELVAAGLSPSGAIQAATMVAAELLGWRDRLGSLEPGKLADLIAVSGNPLEDLTVLTDPANVRLVIKGGATVKTSLTTPSQPLPG